MRAGPTPVGIPLESDGVDAVRRRETHYRRVLSTADAVSIIVALFVAVMYLGEDQLQWSTAIMIPLVVVAAKLTGLYDRDELLLRKSTIDEIPRLFQLATLVTFIFWLLSDHLIAGLLGQGQAFVLWLVLVATMIATRVAARRSAGHLCENERVLVIGEAEVLRRLRDKLEADSHIELVGSVPFEHVIGDIDAMRARARFLRAHRLIVAPGDGAVASPETVRVIRAAKQTGLRVSILPGVLDVVGTAVEFDSISGMTLLGVRRFGLTRSSRLSKRTLDVVVSAVVLTVTLPVTIVLALLIRRDSPGPVLFRQTRVGRNGELFDIVKFRSMVDGAAGLRPGLAGLNEAPDGLFKIADDPRITTVGRWMRRTSLDELPQLLNVLRGEMSLVGPRPLIADEDVRITGTDRQRLDLTPGMTGQWQIAGSARVPLSEMVKIDYLYVASWSLWSDVKILIRTVKYVTGRRGQ